MSVVLNSVLSLAAIESGAFAIRPAPCALRPLLEQVGDQLRPWAAAAHVALAVRVDPALPELLLADGPRLSQVATNFVRTRGSGGV
jgi:signal transduction histidine kinase